MDRKDNFGWTIFSTLLVGIIIGWIASILMKDKKPKIEEKINQFKKNMANQNNRNIKEIFGEVNDDATRIFDETKRNLINRLKEIAVSLDRIDEKNYIETVQNTIREMQKKITLPDDQTERLQTYLENNYETIKNEIKKNID